MFYAVLKLAALTLTLALTPLAGCQTKTTLTYAISTATACDVFLPISYSRLDTVPTRRLIVGHNAAYAEMCGTTENTIDLVGLCVTFAAINYSRLDTTATRREVVGHNAAYARTCGDTAQGASNGYRRGDSSSLSSPNSGYSWRGYRTGQADFYHD